MKARFIGFGLLAIGLVGCGNNDATQTVPASTPVEARSVPAPPSAIDGASLHGLLKSDPATLADCVPQAVTVTWDISSLGPEVNDAEIFADGSLFASGGSTGSSKTGPWTQPGSKFTLKGSPGGAVLDELVVGGPANCAQ